MKKTFTLLVFLLISKTFYAQFSISEIDQIDKVKNNTTYVAMNNLDSEVSKKYIQVFKDNWTFSKIEFITYSQINSYLSPNNYFFSIGGYETEVQSYNGQMKSGLNWSNTHIYLELWTCTEKFFKKKKKKLSLDDKLVISRIELFTDFNTLMLPENIYEEEFDGKNHIRNWGEGILKNYLQNLMTALNKKEQRDLYKYFPDTSELKNLKNQTIYVPDYVLIKFNKFTGDESKKHDAKDIFKDYSFNYELISTNELNNKILSSTEPFYYLVYIKSSTDKYISVINSKTGEYVYTKYTPISYNIGSKDLKELAKAIEK